MRRWIVTGIVVAFLSFVVPLYTTLWLMFSAVSDIDERRQDEEQARSEQIEAIQGSQECVLRLLLVPPEAREGFTVSRILDACPDALPERDAGDDMQAEPHPESRQPWEIAP